MYLDVHGLAFETSIYNRKDQSGICISHSQSASCPELPLRSVCSSAAGNGIRVTHRQPLPCGCNANTGVNKSRASQNSLSQLFSFCDLVVQCEPLHCTLTMPPSALLCMTERRLARSLHFRPVRITLLLIVVSAPYLPPKWVSPTEVELPLRLVLCQCLANFCYTHSAKLPAASPHTP